MEIVWFGKYDIGINKVSPTFRILRERSVARRRRHRRRLRVSDLARRVCVQLSKKAREFWDRPKRKTSPQKATTLVLRGRAHLVARGTRRLTGSDGKKAVLAWEGQKQMQRVQSLPPREAEKQLRGMHPLTSRQAEEQPCRVQRLPPRQAEAPLRGVQLRLYRLTRFHYKLLSIDY